MLLLEHPELREEAKLLSQVADRIYNHLIGSEVTGAHDNDLEHLGAPTNLMRHTRVAYMEHALLQLVTAKSGSHPAGMQGHC